MTGVRLANRWLSVVVHPSHGAKIWELVPAASGRNVLWQYPDRQAGEPAHEASFEDAWAGGWDELFPNDSPCEISGRLLPDHGEWWSRPWEYELLEDGTGLHLQLQAETVPILAEKWIRLVPDRAAMVTTYRLHNLSDCRVPYLWAQHPALRISPAHRIDLPGCSLMPDRSQPGRQRPVRDRFPWPGPAACPDLRVVPPPGDLLEGYFATELAAGWCALTDTANRTGVGFRFDPALFRSVWLWLSYGGWRGQYVALLEPSTGYPSDLTAALATGTCAWLEPGETRQTDFTTICYDGISRVDRIDPDGTVHGT